MRCGVRASVSRRGVGRLRKRTLESLATESPETFTRVELVGQGQSQDTAGASGSQTLMVSEVPTLTVPVGPTPTVFTVPLAVPPAAYSAPPPAVPTAYSTPLPPVPTTYQTPLPPVPTAFAAPTPATTVAPPPVPPPTVPPAAPTYADPTCHQWHLPQSI
ncbi:extensin-like [Zingiber officinale]|uniref:extensin-like n=1 Tax=Zingiber officinale TaxID=94328 RepID=UPI001C4C9CB7|nr:extensin-like [Zingiber officinale]